LTVRHDKKISDFNFNIYLIHFLFFIITSISVVSINFIQSPII